MRLLPAEQRTFVYENGAIIAGLHEHKGCRWYSVFDLRDGEHFARRDDLECLIIDEVNRPTSEAKRVAL